MLISHKHHFIFIHIYKNAGTSISAALLPFAVYNRAHLLAVKLAERYGSPLPEGLNPHPMAGHVHAQKVIETLGQEKFDSYFSFAIVRNPWDWQVSLYNFPLKSSGHRQHKFMQQFANFEEYLRWRCAEEVRYQKDFIFLPDGRQLVKFIGRYENLDADFATVCETIGIQTSLPKLKVSKTRPYQEYYTKETIDLVRKAFAPDIDQFGYKFE
jgi:hypothetical protein